MERVFKAIDAINDRMGQALSYFNILVVGVVCWEIVARYVFNAPTLWASEGMVMLSGFMYVLAGGYAQLQKRHVRIDLLYSRLGMRRQAICDVMTYGFFCLYMYALICHGGIFALDSINVKETSATPWDPIVYPIKSAIPVGAFLLWLQMTADVARKAYVALRGKEL